MFWVSGSSVPLIKCQSANFNLLQIALYAFPLGWLALFFVSLLKFNISYVACPLLLPLSEIVAHYFLSSSFLPIVILALVFNFSNVLGFT